MGSTCSAGRCFRLTRQQGRDAERGEDQRGSHPEGADRQPARHPVSEQHRRYVRQHHPERRAEYNGGERLEPGGEGDRGDLRLVADLGKKKGDQRCQEGAGAADRVPLVDAVRNQRPDRDRDEGQAHDPAQPCPANQIAEQCADQAGGSMVGERRHQDRRQDRQRPAEPCRQQQGQELCLVAEFGEEDDASRDQECVHAEI